MNYFSIDHRSVLINETDNERLQKSETVLNFYIERKYACNTQNVLQVQNLSTYCCQNLQKNEQHCKIGREILVIVLSYHHKDVLLQKILGCFRSQYC